MAGEITLTAQIQLLNGGFVLPSGGGKLGPQNLSLNQTTPGGGAPGQFAATNAAQGALLDVATLPVIAGGWILIINPHATDVITWGPDSATPGTLVVLGTINPGCPVLFQQSAAQQKLRFKSSAASTNLQIYVLSL